jgi:hypothetical protein
VTRRHEIIAYLGSAKGCVRNWDSTVGSCCELRAAADRGPSRRPRRISLRCEGPHLGLRFGLSRGSRHRKPSAWKDWKTSSEQLR